MLVIPEWARCDVEEMVELGCRVNVNAHGLRDDSGSNYIIGVGMFPITAMINHSCRPNCTFAYRGKRGNVRSQLYRVDSKLVCSSSCGQTHHITQKNKCNRRRFHSNPFRHDSYSPISRFFMSQRLRLTAHLRSAGPWLILENQALPCS